MSFLDSKDVSTWACYTRADACHRAYGGGYASPARHFTI